MSDARDISDWQVEDDDIWLDAEPPRRRRSTLTVMLLVFSIAGVMMAVGGTVLYLVAVGWSADFRPEDEAIVLQLEEAEEFLGERLSRGVTPVKTRTRYLDGSWGVSLEYDATDDEPSVYFKSELDYEVTTRDARFVYQGAKLGFSIGSFDPDSEWVVRNDLFRWGDESELMLQLSDDDPLGFVFFGRKGTRIYTLIVSGTWLDSTDDIPGLLRRKLEAVEAWTP